MRRKPFLSMNNPIIYLKRDYDVPKEDIRKIWKIQYKQGKWIPVESDGVNSVKEREKLYDRLGNFIIRYQK